MARILTGNMSPPSDKERPDLDTCYHEAAHAVLDTELGFEVRWVRVRGDIHDGDICMTAVPVHPFQWQAFDLAVSALAGEFAVYRYHGWERPRPNFADFIEEIEFDIDTGSEHGDSDDARALALLKIRVGNGIISPPNPSETLREWLEIAWDEAELRVAELWPEIVAVAERLARSGYLDGEEVRKTIAAARE